MSETKRRFSGPTVPLPWERRTRLWSGLVTARRGQGLLLTAAVVGLGWLAFRVAEHKSRVRTTHAAIHEVQRAIAAFVTEVGRCPHSTTELVHPPRSGAQYLTELPSDGWGKPLEVRCPHPHAPVGALVISAGPSGSFSNDDNIM